MVRETGRVGQAWPGTGLGPKLAKRKGQREGTDRQTVGKKGALLSDPSVAPDPSFSA